MSAESDIDLQETRARVDSWLTAEGWTTSAGSGEGAAWAIRGKDPGGKVVVFAQENQAPHRLVLHASVRLDSSHSQKLEALESSEQEELCWNMRFKLLDMRVDFQGVGIPLEQINLRVRLYPEDLTRTGFFDTLGVVQNAMLYVIWTVRRALDQPAADDLSDSSIN